MFYRILLSILFFVIIILPVKSSAQNESRLKYALFNNIQEPDTSEADSVIKGQPVNLCAGYRIGLPFLVGLHFEYTLMRDDDMMPIYLLTGDISLTLGYAASLALERRIAHSPFYLGCGYNYMRYMFYGKYDIHSLLSIFSLRTSYKKENSFNLSLGALITPKSLSDIYLIPMLHISMVGISNKNSR